MTHSPLKIIFAGTPEFAASALQAILLSPHQVLAVYTQPDRPAGRGLKLTASAVKELAIANSLPVHQPVSLKDANEQHLLKNYHADVMVVAAYGMLLPEAVLTIPKYGCINIHPSKLPRWRGAAPIPRTIFAGDKMTAMTIMQMDKGLDTGDILLQHEYALADNETAKTLHDKMAKMGGDAIVEALNLLAHGKLIPIKQDNTKATYANKMTKEEARIDWQQSAAEIENKIRAFNPWPVAFTEWNGETLRIWMARALSQPCNQAPGSITHTSPEGIDVATSNGTLRLLQLQLPGGKVLSAGEFYNAHYVKLENARFQ